VTAVRAAFEQLSGGGNEVKYLSILKTALQDPNYEIRKEAQRYLTELTKNEATEER
jgi:hypothetical protein